MAEIVTSDLVRSYKMENTKIIIDDNGIEHIMIYNETGFVSMPKAYYDQQQAEQSTPNPTPGAN